MTNKQSFSLNKNKSEIVLYQSPDGKTKVNVRFEGETTWLSQKMMADLFEKDVRTINEHIVNIFQEGELDEKSVIRKFRITAVDGKTYDIKHYNLDVIISVGYRISSLRGTQFRIWATERLREYLIKGFTLDDERLRAGGRKATYFDELLDRIRDIRASERNFYQKVTDIYATSTDYNIDNKLTQEFFATVQNKIHFAIHGHTAAEVIATRANSKQPRMGLTSFKGQKIHASDVTIAKNYLTEPEIKQLNLIVSLYLDFAELQATNRRQMKMSDWITKLEEFLKLSEKQILKNAGSISAKKADRIAHIEYEKYQKEEGRKYLSDFDKVAKKILK